VFRKGFAEVLSCGSKGLRPIRINQRDGKEAFRLLKKQRESFLLPDPVSPKETV
jgi:hypothetical protein